MVAIGYMIESAIALAFCAICVILPMCQLVNYIQNLKLRAKYARFHKAAYALWMLNGMIGLVLCVDLRGAFGIYSLHFRLFLYFLIGSNVIIGVIEWIIALLSSTFVLSGKDFLSNRSENALRFIAISSSLAFNILSFAMVVLTQDIKWFLLLLINLEIISLSTFLLEAYAAFSLYQFGKKTYLLANRFFQDEEFNKNFVLPLMRITFNLLITSILFLGVSALLVAASLKFNSPQSLEGSLNVNPNHYEITITVLMAYWAFGALAFIIAALIWIPIKCGSNQELQDSASDDCLSKISTWFLMLLWRLIVRPIFYAEKEKEKEKQVTPPEASMLGKSDYSISDYKGLSSRA
jgi:hypothetical protein